MGLFLRRRTSRRKRLIRQMKVKLLLLALVFTVSCKKRLWVHPILKRRKSSGEFHRLVGELRLERVAHYGTYFRMSPDAFDKLVEYVKPYIMKVTTNMREPIGPAERVATTLRYLATGDSYQTIAFSYRMDKSTVSRIVPETCSAIWSALQPQVMPEPTSDIWSRIEHEFNRLWQFPNCIGAIDGKHVQVQAPANSGSMFFNYKKNFSIVLLAVADAHYRFVVADIGAYGRQSDGSVFNSSNFGRQLLSGQLDLPGSERMICDMVRYGQGSTKYHII